MGLTFVEYLVERRLRLEDISKQSGWGNSPPNPTDGKLMHIYFHRNYIFLKPGCVAQSVGHLTRKSGVPGSIPGLATYFRFSFCFFKKGSCQLLAKVCARSTG